MDQFHWIVLIIAVVLLIILLTAAAMMLRHQNSDEIFPKTYGKCPDGWKEDGDNCYIIKGGQVMTHNHNSNTDATSYTPSGTISDLSGVIMDTDTPPVYTYHDPDNLTGDSYIPFKSDAGRCNLKKWADHHKIKWDGITNYNNC